MDKMQNLTTQRYIALLPSNGLICGVAPRGWDFTARISTKIFRILYLWKHEWRLKMCMGRL